MKINSKTFLSLIGISSMLFMMVVLSGEKKSSCIPVKPEEPVCAMPSDCEGLPHVDCLGAWSCIEGDCVWQCDINQQCESDKDCGIGFICDFTGAVCLECLGCPCYGKCVKGCWDDFDCAENQYCQNDSWCGGWECAEGEPCPADPTYGDTGTSWCGPGKCVDKPAGCDENNPCPEGYECVFGCACPACYCECPENAECDCAPCPPCECKGECVLSNQCVDDDSDGFPSADYPCGWAEEFDCNDYDSAVNPAAPEQCDLMDNDCNGIVDEGCIKCQKNEDCPTGYYCQSIYKCGDNTKCIGSPGFCVPEEPVGECKDDSDCKIGYYCDPCGCPPGAMCFACIPKCMPIQKCDPSNCDPDNQKCGSTDMGCPEGFTCKCLPDPDCPMCEVCWFGCIPEKEKECHSDKDCDYNQFCYFDLKEVDCCIPNMLCNLMLLPCTGICMDKWDCMNDCPMIACPVGTKMDYCTCKCVPA